MLTHARWVGWEGGSKHNVCVYVLGVGERGRCLVWWCVADQQWVGLPTVCIAWLLGRLQAAAGFVVGRGLVYCSVTLTVLDPRSVANCLMLIHAGWLLVCVCVGGGPREGVKHDLCVCVGGGGVDCWAAARACTATLFPQEAARAGGGAGPWGGWRDRRGLLV